MFNDFRKFLLRGNIIDLLIGFTVGASFANVAKSFVSDVLMPPIGVILGRTDFSSLFWLVKEGTTPGPYHTLSDAQRAGAVTINYGLFLNNVISLLIVGLAVYILVKFINRVNDQLEEFPLVKRKKRSPEEPSLKKCPYCLTTIPYRAVKCSACTADLSLNPDKK